MFSTDELLPFQLPNAGLQAAGFGLVALLYGAYTAHLVRGGLLRKPVDRFALWFAAAVLATVAWGLAGVADQVSTKLLTWHLALAFDQLRYAAWAGFMLLLLRPMAKQLAPWRARLWQALPGVLLALGGACNALLGLEVGPQGQAARWLVISQLAWAVLGLLLVEQVFRNQAEQNRWGAKPLCLGLGVIFLFDIYLFSQALMFGNFDSDALTARSLVHAVVFHCC